MSKKQNKLIIILLALLLAFASGSYLLSRSRQPAKPANTTPAPTLPAQPEQSRASLSLIPDSKQITPGKTLRITINLSAPNTKVTGTDAVIIYDPKLLKFKQATPSGMFSQHPRTKPDRPGRVIITGLKSGSPLSSPSGELATLSFITLKPGTAALTLDPDRSTIVQAKSAKNVLTGTDNTNIEILD